MVIFVKYITMIFKLILIKNLDLYSVEYHKKYMIYRIAITIANGSSKYATNEKTKFIIPPLTHSNFPAPETVIYG